MSSHDVAKQNSFQAAIKSQLKVRARPSGIHTFDRTTGLNVLGDDVWVPVLTENLVRVCSDGFRGFTPPAGNRGAPR